MIDHDRAQRFAEGYFFAKKQEESVTLFETEKYWIGLGGSTGSINHRELIIFIDKITGDIDDYFLHSCAKEREAAELELSRKERSYVDGIKSRFLDKL